MRSFRFLDRGDSSACSPSWSGDGCIFPLMTTPTTSNPEMNGHEPFSVSVGLSRRVLLWVASLFMIGVSVYGFVSNQLFAQVVWADYGLSRFIYLAAIFACAGVVFFWLGQRYFRPCFLLLAGLTVWAAVGAGALAGALICLLAFLSIGDLILGSDRDRLALPYDAGIALALGGTVFVALFEYTARSNVHYAFVYLSILVVSIAINPSGIKYWIQFARTWATPSSLRGPLEFALELSVGFFLFFHMLLVLKPDVSADGLAVHLTVPALIANAHRFDFDFHRFVWALWPMGSDWLFTLAYGLGGEFAARLLNFFFLCGLTFFLFGFIVEMGSSRAIARLCLLLWLSTPLVELVTGSLFSENTVALLSVACLAAACAYRKTFHHRYLAAFAALLGGALASKFGTLAFFIPLVPCVIVLSIQMSSLRPRHSNRMRGFAVAALLITIVAGIGAPSFVRAWRKTGNPVYPLMNNVFKSPYYSQTPIENRYHGTIDPRTIYAMTYKMGYLEAMKGSFGFEYLVLIPLVLLGMKRSWATAARLSVFVGICFLIASISFIAYERYLYTGLPLVLTGTAALFEDLRKGDRWLYRLLFSAGLFCVVLNAYFLPASGWYHNGGFFNPIHDTEERRAYEIGHAPGREIVTYLNDTDPGAAVAFLVEPEVAELKGPIFFNNWYNLDFYMELHSCPDANAIAKRVALHKIKYFVGHPIEQMATESLAIKAFIAGYLMPEYSVNNFVLYRWKTPAETQTTGLAPSLYPRSAEFRFWATAAPMAANKDTRLRNIHWSVPGVAKVEIHVESPSGPLFAMGGPAGDAITGPWATPGVKFYLQDAQHGDGTLASRTLAELVLK